MDRDPTDPQPLAGSGLPLPDRTTPYLVRRILRTRGTQRHAHLRDLGFRALGRVARSVVVDDRGTRIHLRTDDEVSRLVYIFGLFDEALLARALAILAALGRPDVLAGRTFLDAGANIGTSTLAAIRLGAKSVVAIEPHPDNVRTLQLNVVENGLDDRVRVIAAAASDVASTVRLEVDPRNSADHRVRVAEAPAGNAFDEARREVIEVPALTIDSLGLDPAEVGLAWFDVQGHEARALEGARDLLGHDIPVVLEYWPYGLRASGDLDRLHRTLAERYDRFVDLRDPFTPGEPPPVRPTADIARLPEQHAEPLSHTELLALPRER